jgi:hypothetical protein
MGEVEIFPPASKENFELLPQCDNPLIKRASALLDFEQKKTMPLVAKLSAWLIRNNIGEMCTGCFFIPYLQKYAKKRLPSIPAQTS